MRRNKIAFAFSALLLLALGACGSKENKNYGTNEFNQTTNVDNLSSFDLLTPFSGFTSKTMPEFSWEASQNAEKYTFEIASTAEFITDDIDEVYLKKTNISSTVFSLSAPLPKKNQLYYWKVTAINTAHSLVSESTFTFYFEADTEAEVKIDIDDAEDWTLHQEGSYADISVDRSNFFGNDENSLAISFEKEKTNQGIPSSDGWIVITKSEEKDLYGTDSLYFNLYYSGDSANINVRLVDNDGEYWYCPVKVSQNAKQTILLRFSDFILRMSDTPVVNEVFNFEHIKYVEIVFEQSFGDGVCLISNLKAVSYAKYTWMFVDLLNFNDYPKDTWEYEAYHFQEVISDDGTQLDLSYPSGIGGYGFTRIPINRYFTSGNAIKVSVKYTGYSDKSSNFLIRILEEDNDRWSYKQPLQTLTKDQWIEFVIPYASIGKTDYINGDGARQFYYVLNLQLGVNGMYGAGSVSFKDFEIINYKDIYPTTSRVVGEDGVLETFDDYTFNCEPYYNWNLTDSNKDEYISIDSSAIARVGNNVNCAKMLYKSDMGIAGYHIMCSTSVTDFSSVSLWLKDNSLKKEAYGLTYLDDVTADTIIQITLRTGEQYRYYFPSISKEWKSYTIAFSDFVLDNAGDFKETPNPLTSNLIANFAIGFQYYYFLEDGVTRYPVYQPDNAVYVDTISFGHEQVTTVSDLGGVISPDADDANNITIDKFNYQSSREFSYNWYVAKESESGTSLELSNDTPHNDNGSSMKIGYKYLCASPSIRRDVSMNASCKAKGMILDLKGDGAGKVYINIYLNDSSQFRYEFVPSASWVKYTIGFNNFSKISGSTTSISSKRVPNIVAITFGVTNYSASEYILSAIYVDEIYLNYDIASYDTLTQEVY